MTQKTKVAYLLSRFPQLTQTFVTREIYWIREHNIQTVIFSLSKPKSLPTEKKARELINELDYLSKVYDSPKPLIHKNLAKSWFKIFKKAAMFMPNLYRGISQIWDEPNKDIPFFLSSFFASSLLSTKRITSFLQSVIEEAGGIATDFEGKPVREGFRTCVSAGPGIYEQLRELLVYR